MADVIGQIEVQLGVDSKDLEAAMARARSAMAALEAEAKRLEAEEKKGIITTADYTAKLIELTVAQGRVGAAMAAAASRTNSVVTAMNGMGGVANNAGLRILYLGQTVDDLQYGFSAIVNQIPMVAMAFGVGPGLAGALSVAGVAANQLIKNWDKLTAAFGAREQLTATEEMERLGKATTHTAEQTKALAAAKRDLAAVDKLLTTGTPMACAAAGAAGTAIAMMGGLGVTGGTKVEQGLSRFFAGTADTMSPAISERKRILEDQLKMQMGVPERLRDREDEEYIDSLNKKIIELKGRLAKDLKKTVDDTMLAGAENPAELAKIIRRTIKDKKEFFGTPDEAMALAVRLEHADPAAMKARADRESDQALSAAQAEGEKRAKADEAASIAREDAATVKRIQREQRGPELLEQKAAMEERGKDLQWQMRLLMNPDRVGKSLGMDAYEASFKAKTGLSEEVKRLHAIEELNKEIAKNGKNLNLFIMRNPILRAEPQ